MIIPPTTELVLAWRPAFHRRPGTYATSPGAALTPIQSMAGDGERLDRSPHIQCATGADSGDHRLVDHWTAHRQHRLNVGESQRAMAPGEFPRSHAHVSRSADH